LHLHKIRCVDILLEDLFHLNYSSIDIVPTLSLVIASDLMPDADGGIAVLSILLANGVLEASNRGQWLQYWALLNKIFSRSPSECDLLCP